MKQATLSTRLEAVFEPGADGCPRARVATGAALELRGPFERASHPPLFFLRNTTAGILGGDCYEVDLRAEAGASLQVASSAATKVYEMEGQSARSSMSLAALPGSRLTWGPHATILQAGASLRQTIEITLHPGAVVLVGEVLVLGRLARGEYCAFQRFDSEIHVRGSDGRPLYDECYELNPGATLDASLGGRGVVASVYGLGLSSDGFAERWESAFGAETLAGWSTLPNEAGVVGRCLTGSLSQGQSFVERTLSLLGCSASEAVA